MKAAVFIQWCTPENRLVEFVIDLNSQIILQRVKYTLYLPFLWYFFVPGLLNNYYTADSLSDVFLLLSTVISSQILSE